MNGNENGRPHTSRLIRPKLSIDKETQMQLAQPLTKPAYSIQPYNVTAALTVQPKETIEPCNVAATLTAQTEETEQSRLDKFKAALDDIFVRGLNLRKHENSGHDKATIALSKLLGIAQDIYGKAGIVEKEELMAYLRQRCRSDGLKKFDKRTTIFHLLSRQFRGSDSKQASSDAKILDRADREGETEQTFCAWVKKHNGLNNIKISSIKRPQASATHKLAQKTQDTGNHTHDRKFVVCLYNDEIPGMFLHLTKEKIYPAKLVRFSDGTVKIAVYEKIDQSNVDEAAEGEFDEDAEVETEAEVEEEATVEINSEAGMDGALSREDHN